MSSVSGMAAAIRAVTDSETFDLAGQNTTTITNTVKSAFQEPLPLQEMIRVTFITGAGKLGRQKYDEGAAKAVTSTLRDLGFEDDRGASCVIECAGSFKMQHDTGKNLKTVVVFPNIVGPPQSDLVEGDMAGLSIGHHGQPTALLPDGSPQQMIAMSSKPIFERMVKSKCSAWAQKKGALAALDSIKTLLQDLDAKLFTGTPLTDPEQTFYDAVSITTLEEKEAFLKKEMQTQVEQGNLTSIEKDTLLNQNAERLKKLSQDITDSHGKPKKIEKLKTMQQKAEQRKELLEGITPKVPARLRHEPEITKLRAEMAPLLKMESEAKGRLLTIKETQTLARKNEIEEQIADLEASSRGWFEDDPAFQARLEVSRKAFAARQKHSKKKPAAAAKNASATANGGFKVSSNSKFITPGAAKKGAWGKPVAQKKSKAKGGSLFAAMMNDSDSD